jgi:hypothetical protein
MALLEVEGLKVYFHTRNGVVKAVWRDLGHSWRIWLRKVCHLL